MKADLKNKKILFAPHEIGGQMQLMVGELRRRGYYASAATYVQQEFGHINDIHLNTRPDPRSRLRFRLSVLLFALWAAMNYDIFHFFWGESLFGFWKFPRIDLPILNRAGRKIFVHFRGIDIIDLAYFDYLRARTAELQTPEPRLSRPDQLHSVAQWRRYANSLLVSEPDLFRVVPEATLVQQAVDLRYWYASNVSARDGIIRIAHAPSLRRKKGTEFVERSVAELKAQGYPVELVLIENVAFDQVRELYAQCDIGIDQVLYGWYGKVSIEMMAMNKPVVCYIEEDWRKYRPDMPITSATPSSLTQQLAQLIDDLPLRKSLGEAGRPYVEKYHDVVTVVDQCLQIYQESLDRL